MPRSDHPTYSWPSQRHYLNEALKHLAAFTDNLKTFLELADQADTQAQVLKLDFGTTSVVVEAETSQPEPVEEKRALPSREQFPRQRAKWRFDEEQAIRSALLLGFDYAWIAEHLGRTRKAVKDKAQELRNAGAL